MTDAEYAALQAALIADPEAGTMYSKNVADSIPAHLLRQIREEADNA